MEILIIFIIKKRFEICTLKKKQHELGMTI